MAFATVGTAIGIISGIFSAANSAKSLFFTEPAFTLDDIQRIQNSSNAHFFEGQNITDLVTYRNRFYDSYQKTLKDTGDNIKQDDLKQGGWLYDLYSDLRAIIGQSQVILERLNWLWRNNDLHVDTLDMLMRVFVDGYAALMHMQGVYSQLHRIELGLDTLDDHSLVTDTRNSLLYIKESLQSLPDLRDKVRKARLDLVGKVEEHEDPYLAQLWYTYTDTYSALGSTAEAYKLYFVKPTTSPPSPNPNPDAWLDAAPGDYRIRWDDAEANTLRTRRYNQASYRIDSMGGDNAVVLCDKLRNLETKLKERESKQG